MAEKIIPDVDFFGQEIFNELQESFTAQRIRAAERLINFSPEKISELHLQDWYGHFWKLVTFLNYVDEPPENVENAAQQVFRLAQNESNPVRVQYFALALLLFGKFKEFDALKDEKIWSENLREDYGAYFHLSKLTSLSANFHMRAHVRRNQQIKNFLYEKYSYVVQKYSAATLKDCPKVAQKDYKIWYCWLQGKENLPPLLQCCYNSLKMHAGNHRICFIDEQNFSDYVALPEYILKKFSEGKISKTHFSDILRINLLEKYGGLWLDSTILVTEPLENHKNFLKMPYFTQKYFKEKSNFSPYVDNPAYGRWGCFIQGTAILHNPLLAFMKDFYNEYWRDYDEIIDYVLMDFMMDMAYENIPDVKKEIDAVPINNIHTWGVWRNLNLPYEKFQYDKMFEDTFLFKLNWRSEIDMQAQGTVFKVIQKKYLGE